MSRANSYELIVVGCGAAGLSAAMTYVETAAADGGAPQVAVLESAPEGERGGATRWTTAGLRIDENDALDPTWVEHQYEVSKGLSDLEYLRAFEREVPGAVRFLKDHGVEILYFKTDLPSARTGAATPNGGGRAIVDRLAALIDETDGAEILYQTEAVRLSVGSDGRVDGVVVRGPDGLLRTLSATAVVLACGGFEGDRAMLTSYLGEKACDLKLIAPGIAFNKGAGIRMAMEIGAETSGQFDGMHSELIDRRTDRADAVIYGHTFGIVVNGEGKRFFDEGWRDIGGSFELIAYEVWRNQNQTAFFVTDEKVMSDERLARWFDSDMPPVQANTIAELARQLGLDPDALEKTVNEFNAACGPEEFDHTRYDGKAAKGIEPPKSNWATPIDAPPFSAYPVTTAITFTYGGLKTDTSARVLSTGGVPIPGLYAAGEIVGLYYHEYVAATSVLKAVAFGRVAAAHAAGCASEPASNPAN